MATWKRVPYPYGIGPDAAQRAAKDEYQWRSRVLKKEADERRHRD